MRRAPRVYVVSILTERPEQSDAVELRYGSFSGAENCAVDIVFFSPPGMYRRLRATRDANRSAAGCAAGGPK